MGWRFERFGHYTDAVTARLDEHGGDKEARDERLWEEFVTEADAAVRRIARAAKYSELAWFIDDD